MDEDTLDGTTLSSGATPFGTPGGTPVPQVNVDRPLSVDEVLEKARRVERTARICLRGDLQAEYDELLEELQGLVDLDGNVLATGEQALSDAGRAEDITARLTTLRTEMTGAMRAVRFRAMPDVEWRVFEAEHRVDGVVADEGVYYDKMMARCAVSPKLTQSAAESLRNTLSARQMAELSNQCYLANVTGGVDIPKSLPSSPDRRRGSSAKS